MKALQIHLDGTPMVTAGLPGFGVVSCILGGRRREARNVQDGRDEPAWTYDLKVGGLHSPEPGLSEFLEWCDVELAVGQEVLVRVVEVDEGTEPVSRHRETQLDRTRQKRAYLEYLQEQIAKITADLESEG